jgi:indolepyruvate ferredoxin oxidoreductase beta subunit
MRNSNVYNILFCGTGGQGVLKASEVCGVAAVNAGFKVKKSEVHGMAQRGGSVESHLRIGKEIYSPLIIPGQADFLVSFHEGETKRMKHFLCSQGVDFTPFLEKADQLPDHRFKNTFFLGVLASRLPIPEENWYDAIKTVIGKKIDENIAIFRMGSAV